MHLLDVGDNTRDLGIVLSKQFSRSLLCLSMSHGSIASPGACYRCRNMGIPTPVLLKSKLYLTDDLRGRYAG